MQQQAAPVPLPGAHPSPQAPGEQRQAALYVVLLCPQAHPPQHACHAQCCRQQALQVNANISEGLTAASGPRQCAVRAWQDSSCTTPSLRKRQAGCPQTLSETTVWAQPKHTTKHPICETPESCSRSLKGTGLDFYIIHPPQTCTGPTCLVSLCDLLLRIPLFLSSCCFGWLRQIFQRLEGHGRVVQVLVII